ncbi:MAG: hypothetical protein IKN27_09120 [Selenomonadaceae bacterium]|nr:hypothetical protein [Selenomonadaceae bacterium]
MRVLLVTWTDQLLEKLSILNPELEYCAIVVDEVEPAKEILKRVGLPATLLYPLYDLKECVRDFYYDYVLCVEQGGNMDFLKLLREYEVPKNKRVGLNFLDNGNFLVERSLRYFKEHAAEFDMFATGMSYTELGLDVTRFKRKLFNFGKSSQDLYYDFQTAKFVVSCGGGGTLRYALIGLAPYSFHYDQSKFCSGSFRLLQYAMAFRDLHNFFMSVEDYCKIFREEYLSFKLPLIEQFDVTGVHSDNILRLMTFNQKLGARERIDKWANRNYPETRDENVQILDGYLTLCEQNRIRPIMFLPPVTEGYKKHFIKPMLDEFYYFVRQACKKHPSAIFIDSWKLQGLSDADFWDVDHLNIQGAAKFSIFLNDFIERL